MDKSKYIVYCTYISEWDGEIDSVDSMAQIDLTTGIVNDIKSTDAYDDIDLGNCMGEYAEFMFEDKHYRLKLEYNEDLCEHIAESIPLIESIKSMVQLEDELPNHNVKMPRSKI